MNSIWALEIITSQLDNILIYGAEEVLQAAHDEWLNYMREGENENVVLDVHGMTDTADRAPCRVSVVAEAVCAMRLTKVR